MGTRGQGRHLHARDYRGREGSGRPEFLCAARHRRGVPADSDFGSPGRKTVQAAGLYEELFDDHRGGAGHYSRSGAAPRVEPHEGVHVPAEVDREHRQRDRGGQDPFGGKTSDQQDSHWRLRADL